MIIITIIHPSDIRVFSKRLGWGEYTMVVNKRDSELLIFDCLDGLTGDFIGSAEMGDETAVSLN